MKKLFIGILLVIAVTVANAATNTASWMIHEKAIKTPLDQSDLFVVDTLSEYRSVGWSNICDSVTNISAYQSEIATNALYSAVTNLVSGVNPYTSNLTTLTINMDVPYSDFSTNASFDFVGITGVSDTRYQTAVTFVTNSLGSLITLGAAPSVHAEGTWNCTNVTTVTWFCNAGRWTNGISFPLW